VNVLGLDERDLKLYLLLDNSGPCPEGVTQRNALALVAAHDVVLDCTDNVASRYMLSDACTIAGWARQTLLATS